MARFSPSRFTYFAILATLHLFAAPVVAQTNPDGSSVYDYNADGTATLRMQCLQSGDCNPTGGGGGDMMDPFSMIPPDVLGELLSCAFLGDCTSAAERRNAAPAQAGRGDVQTGLVRARVIDIKPNGTLSLRAGPGMGYSVVGEIPWNSQEVTVETGRCEAISGDEFTWCPVTYANAMGWASSRHLIAW